MTDHSDRSWEDRLRQGLQVLEPTPPASEEQWQRNVSLLRGRTTSRPRSVRLAAGVAAVVVLLIAATFLLVRSGVRSDGPAQPNPGGLAPIVSGCGSQPATASVTSMTGAGGGSIGLKFAGSEPFQTLCVQGDNRVGSLMPELDQTTYAGLLSFATVTWLVAVPPPGTTSVEVTSSDESTSAFRLGGTGFVRVAGQVVIAVPVGGRPSWVRTAYSDSSGSLLRLSKTPLSNTATVDEARRAEASKSAAVASAATASLPPSSSGPPDDYDFASCLPKTTSVGPSAPEYWLALSCNGTPAKATLWSGHGGTAVAPGGGMVGSVPDLTRPIPHLAQFGGQTDVLIGALTPGTATARITLTDGTEVVFGTGGTPWVALRANWRGFVHLGVAANRAERIATFDSEGKPLAQQELFY